MTTLKFCRYKNDHIAIEPHECPFEQDIMGNNDPEYCTCCETCKQDCRDDI